MPITRSEAVLGLNISQSDLSTLFGAGELTPGYYNITDRADAGVSVKANSPTSIDFMAIGIFYNADYQVAGDYSGVAGFGAQLGVWNSGLAPVAGDVVIWNNLHYENLTGAVGTAPSGDAVNWGVLAKLLTNGYIQETDEIWYDLAADLIFKRSDLRGNIVSATGAVTGITDFQWGNDAVKGNQVYPGSKLSCKNNLGQIKDNVITSESIIDAELNTGIFSSNNFTEASQCTITINSGSIVSNSFRAASSLVIDDNDGIVENNDVSSESLLTINGNTVAGTVNRNILNCGSELTVVTNSGTVRRNHLTSFSQGSITANAATKENQFYNNVVFAI